MESGQQTREGQLDQLRTNLRGMWSAVAPAWEQNADFVDERGSAMTAALLDGVEIGEGSRVLELACGPGGLGLTVAERFPGAQVVLSDVAQQMAAIAAKRARQRGLENVTVAELDLEQIDQPDDSFDAALCREGIMLVPEPARAAAEIRRILRPGGTAALSVWGPRSRNPWLTAMLDAIGAQLGGEFPPPGVPGPLSLGEDDSLRTALIEGGFQKVEVREVEVPWRGASFEEWWKRTKALAGPVGGLLDAQPADAVDAIQAHARESLSRYQKADELEIPGVTLVGFAQA